MRMGKNNIPTWGLIPQGMYMPTSVVFGTVAQWRSQNAEILRTSMGDYCFKQ